MNAQKQLTTVSRLGCPPQPYWNVHPGNGSPRVMPHMTNNGAPKVNTSFYMGHSPQYHIPNFHFYGLSQQNMRAHPTNGINQWMVYPTASITMAPASNVHTIPKPT